MNAFRVAFLTAMYMLGIVINHIAVQKLLVGDDAVAIYDFSLVWLIVFYLIIFAVHLSTTSKKSDNGIADDSG